MRLLTPADYKQTPWKNGGGRTEELLVHPHADGGFLWRISIATIAASGPFSVFPGTDRIIMTLSGPPVYLDFAAGHSQELARFVPFSFPGEDTIFGRLAGAPSGQNVAATDFNVMTRRAECAATLVYDAVSAGTQRRIEPCGGWQFVYVISGSVRLDGGAVNLGQAHSLLLEPADSAAVLTAASPCQLAVTTINWTLSV